MAYLLESNVVSKKVVKRRFRMRRGGRSLGLRDSSDNGGETGDMRRSGVERIHSINIH